MNKKLGFSTTALNPVFPYLHSFTSTCSGAIPDPAEKLSRKKLRGDKSAWSKENNKVEGSKKNLKELENTLNAWNIFKMEV